MDRAETSNIVEKVLYFSEYFRKSGNIPYYWRYTLLSHEVYKKTWWPPVCQRWADFGIFYRAKHGQPRWQRDEWGGIVPSARKGGHITTQKLWNKMQFEDRWILYTRGCSVHKIGQWNFSHTTVEGIRHIWLCISVNNDDMWGVPHSNRYKPQEGRKLVAIIVCLVEIPVKLCSEL